MILPGLVNPPHKTTVRLVWARRSFCPLWAACEFYEFFGPFFRGRTLRNKMHIHPFFSMGCMPYITRFPEKKINGGEYAF